MADMADTLPPSKVQKKNTVEYYYFINANYPGLSMSECDAREHERKAIALNKSGKFDGADYNPVVFCDEFAYYVYTFKHSVPANEATELQFSMDMKLVALDSLLPKLEPETIVSIDFKLTTFSAYNQGVASAVASTFASTVDGICQTIRSQNEISDPNTLIDVIKSLNPTDVIKSLPNPNPTVRPSVEISLDENGYSKALLQQVAAKASQMGFAACWNTASINGLQNSQASKYFQSRPDLVMYKANDVYVVMSTGEEPDEDEVTLEGFVTENQKSVNASVPVVGKLLAGMEKVAGDLAYTHIKRAPEEKKKVPIYNHQWTDY